MTDNTPAPVFSPAQVMDSVRDRIKATFVGLISDEQWDSLIKKEVEVFFSEVRGYRSSNDSQPSPFQTLVRSELAEHTRAKIKEDLKEYMTNEYSYGGSMLKPNELMKKLVIENAAEIQGAVLSSMIQNTINNMRNH